jgi:hypothetical protein
MIHLTQEKNIYLFLEISKITAFHSDHTVLFADVVYVEKQGSHFVLVFNTRSSTSGGRSVGIMCLRTKGHGVVVVV